jgi:hypothetical protein
MHLSLRQPRGRRKGSWLACAAPRCAAPKSAASWVCQLCSTGNNTELFSSFFFPQRISPAHNHTQLPKHIIIRPFFPLQLLQLRLHSLPRSHLAYVRSVAPSDHRHPNPRPPHACLQVGDTHQRCHPPTMRSRLFQLWCVLCFVLSTHGTLVIKIKDPGVGRTTSARPVRSRSTRCVATMADSSASPATVGFIGAGIMGRGGECAPLFLDDSLFCPPLTLFPSPQRKVRCAASNPVLPSACVNPAARRPHGAEPDEGRTQADGVEPHARGVRPPGGRGRNAGRAQHFSFRVGTFHTLFCSENTTPVADSQHVTTV